MFSTHNQIQLSSNKENEASLYAMLLSISSFFPAVLNAAIELNLFEIMAQANPNACMSPSEIASQLPTQNPDAPFNLDRMLRLLASHSLLTCSLRTLDDGRVERLYGLAPAGKFFIKNEDGESVAFFSLFGFQRANVEARLQHKDVVEGGDLFKKVHGMTLYDYKNINPTYASLFNKAMIGLTSINMNIILETYKGFEGVSLLVDVGGGTGASLNMIVSKYPSIKGISFDQPQVIQNAPFFSGIEHVGGDMFRSVPRGDAIMIKSTCHNWSDEHCIKLLKNCYEVLPQNGKVIVIDYLMPEEPDSSNATKFITMIDNAMFHLAGGKERTEKEFEALCKASGFSGFQVICCANSILGVMEFNKKVSSSTANQY